MIKPDLWKLCLSSIVNGMFYDKRPKSKPLSKTEQDNLLFSIESFIDEKKMDFDSFCRTNGRVSGKRVIFGD
jgi:hypothetical protein